MVNEFFINGQCAQKTYGISLAAGSFTALLTPVPVKEYITNKSALSHGKQVLCKDDYRPKLDERDIQLTLHIHARDMNQFLERYNRFVEVLQKGKIDISTKYQPGVVYHCLYISCSQFLQYNGRLGKFVLKLNEPNPNKRKTDDAD